MTRHRDDERTGLSASDLGHRTLTGLFWNLLERVGVRLIQFLPTIILARLLSPAEFGLVGMLTLFIAIANASLDSGFSAALVQRKKVTALDESSMFYFNLFVGTLLTSALCLAAPWIARFYEQPALVALTRGLSLQILINAFGLVQTARLTRQLDFRAQLQANVLAAIASGIVGVAAAYAGWGAWALVAQTLARSLLGVTALWVICDWRPLWAFGWDSLRTMFAFGSRMYLARLTSTFFNNLHQAFIGKVFSAASLGYFSRAASMRSIVVDTTSDTLGRVLFPAMSSIQSDAERLKRASRRAIMLSTLVHFPLMAGLAAAARPLFQVLFTAKWAPAVPYFQLLCASGLFYPLHLINLNILKVKGRSDLVFRLSLAKQGLLIANMVLTYRWGIDAMLAGQLVVTILGYGLTCYYSERMVDYSVREQLADMFPAFGIAAVTGGSMALLGVIWAAPSALVLLGAQGLLGALLYGGMMLLFQPDGAQAAVGYARRWLATRWTRKNRAGNAG